MAAQPPAAPWPFGLLNQFENTVETGLDACVPTPAFALRAGPVHPRRVSGCPLPWLLGGPGPARPTPSRDVSRRRTSAAEGGPFAQRHRPRGAT